MNPKFRLVYLIIGFTGLAALILQFLINLPDINEVIILYIAVPDMLFFFLAYKTYPPDSPKKRKWCFLPVI